MNEFAKRLKRERELRSWSQEQLAERIGTTARNVGRWERSQTFPGPYFRQQLCAIFDKNTKELGLAPCIIDDDSRPGGGGTGLDGQNTSLVPEMPSLYDPLIPLSLATPHGLIGRDPLLTSLTQCLGYNGEISTFTALYGLPGVGKTALAAELARDRDLLKHFRDGVLWVGLGVEPNVLGQLSRWGRLLGIVPGEMSQLQSPTAWAEKLCSIIGMRRMLLVIDDVWEAEHALAFTVGGPQCSYLVTTRFPSVAYYLAGSGAIAVNELDEQDSTKLLTHFAPHVVSREPEKVRDLVNAVGGLPLALSLMGKYLYVQGYSGQPRRIQAALDRLQDAGERLHLTEPRTFVERSPSLPQNSTASLQTIIALSDQRLPPVAQIALRALATFLPKPNSFPEEAAVAVCAQPVEVLDTLLDAGFLESPEAGRYTLHQTIVSYARAHLSEDAVYQRLVDYAVHYVASHPKEYEALEQESSTILLALRIAFERGMFKEFAQGVMSFVHFLQIRGLNMQAEKLLQQASQAARELGNSEHKMIILLRLGETAEKRGNFAQAETYLHESLTLARQYADLRHISASLLVLGWVVCHQENYAQGKAYLQEGLALAQQVEDRELVCDHLVRLSMLEPRLGSFVQAEIYGKEGLLLAQQFEDYDRMSLALWNLAGIAANQGDYTKAEAYYLEALKLARQIGHYERISHILTNLGWKTEEQGDYLQAEAYYREALELARQIGFCTGLTCYLLAALGRIAAGRGDGTQAEIYYSEGLLLARQEGHHEPIANLLVSWARLKNEQGNDMQADVYSQEALTLVRRLGLGDLISEILNEWGEIQLKRQQFKKALEAFQEALECVPEGYQILTALAHYGLARATAVEGNLIQARQQGETSLAILEAAGHGKAAEVRCWLGTLPTITNDQNAELIV